jgi:hypothetical protein
MSIMSAAHIWWSDVYYIPTCGGIDVQDVLIFHTVLLALQPVAAGLIIHGMKQGEQV